MKDRLIELLRQAEHKYLNLLEFEKDILADYLLENGVIVPPCKVGQTVYVITYCRCGNVECYEQGHCHKKTTKKTPKSYYTTMEQQMGYKTFWQGNKSERKYVPKGTICHKVLKKPFAIKMVEDFGKTVFLTYEEAQKALGGAEE